MYYFTPEERIAEEVACRVSNITKKIVEFKRVTIAGSIYIQFYTPFQPQGSSWPAEVVIAAADRGAEFAQAVVDALARKGPVSA